MSQSARFFQTLGCATFLIALSTPALAESPEAKAPDAKEEAPASDEEVLEEEVLESDVIEETSVDETNQGTVEAPKEAVGPETTQTASAANAVVTKAEPKKKVEEVYITGSRVRRLDLNTAAPVSVMTRQDIDRAGLKSIGDVLQRLPAQSNAINTQFNNSGDGSTRVNLRGIGSQRTLVLVNGRRFVGGGVGANGSVDLNSIPSEVIERVEVLKDGASAIYGSDAIGGVVNIITKKDFAGVELSSYAGGTPTGGFVSNLGITGGEHSEDGGFLLSFQYFNQQPMMAGNKSLSRSDLDYDFTTGEVSTQGSSAVPDGQFRDRGEGVGNRAWQTIGANAAGSKLFTNDSVDGFRAFSTDGNRDVGEGDLYNYQPENYLLTPNQRLSLWGHGDYQVSRRAQVYFEGSFTNRRSEQLLAPEPLGTTTEGIVLSSQSIYNPFGRDFTDVRRRLVENGNRVYNQDLTTYRAVIGVNGTYAESGWLKTWKWDASLGYGRTMGTDANEGRLRRSKLAAAVGPSFFDDNGRAVCGTRSAPIADCTPVNLFGGAGTITQDMLKPLTYTGIAHGYSDQRIMQVETNGELFELNRRPVSLAFGYQFRREEGGYTPDPLTAAGDTTGSKEFATNGAYNEHAGYAELDIPLLAELPAVDLLEAQAAVRVFNFNSFGTGATYKFGGRWQVFPMLALRGTYSTGFRAPSIRDLYRGEADSFQNTSDPCDNTSGTRDGIVDANCSADGLTRDFRDASNQLPTRVGGSQDLQPEKANVRTAGLVITPKGSKLIEGLSFTADYFSIDISDAIQERTASVILANCYGNEGAARSDCELITRDAQGFVTEIRDLQTNLGGTQTSGVDFGLGYGLPTTFGQFRFNFDAVWLHKYDQIQSSGEVVHGLGVYDLEAVYPSIRVNTGVSWSLDAFNLGTMVRVTGPIRECENNDCSLPDALSRRVSPSATADLYAGYGFTTDYGFTSLQAGLNNVLNSNPPIVYQGFLANSDAAAYDYLGRYFYVGLRHQL